MSAINIIESKSDKSQPTAAVSLPMTVLICTRGRGDSLVPTGRSILAAEVTCAELLIVDQSSDDSTELALIPFRKDPRLRYMHTTTRGKGLSLNEGLEVATYEIVAITDDDCEVSPDWLQPHLDAFAADPQLVLTYGNVLPVEHDPDKGFIPTYYVLKDRHVTNVWQKLSARGIGANTAVRRTPILEMGGFDPELCPGGLFKACVDRDMTIRCILSGYHIYESRDSKVYHYGFRNWEQGRKLACNAFYGIGAAHIKAIKCGRPLAIVLLIWELMAYALLPSLWSVITLRRPFGWNRVINFLLGVQDGWKFPVDKKLMIFRRKNSDQRPIDQHPPGDSLHRVDSEACPIQ